MSSDLIGKVVLHRDDATGEHLDRFDRNLDQVRAHIAFATDLLEEVRSIAGRSSDELILGREAGPKFWSRWMAQVAAIERVVERDNRFLQALESAAGRQR